MICHFESMIFRTKTEKSSKKSKFASLIKHLTFLISQKFSQKFTKIVKENIKIQVLPIF